MSEQGMTDRMWNHITRMLIDTGRPPHYAELARLLGVSPAESRTILHAVLEAYPIGWLHPETDYIASFPPLNGLPTPVPGDGARRAEVVCTVRIRGDIGDLALPGGTCPDRRG